MNIETHAKKKQKLVFINLVVDVVYCYIEPTKLLRYFSFCLPPRTSHFTFNAALIVCGAVRLFITVPFVSQKIGIDGNSKKTNLFFTDTHKYLDVLLRMLFVRKCWNNRNKQFFIFLHFILQKFLSMLGNNSLVPIKDSFTLTFLVGPLKKSTLHRYAAASSNLT